MMRVIGINLAIAMGTNFIAVILTLGGRTGPVIGALIHNAGSVRVISALGLPAALRNEGIVDRLVPCARRNV
ncbi:MAG: hypothetical protein Q3X95_01210 [Duodenibacillus sp.]|nr:hypothetical protein [Duodenibacillus sp.]